MAVSTSECIKVFGHRVSADKSAAFGYLRFTPATATPDRTAPLHGITQQPVVAVLDRDGYFQVELTASNDPGWVAGHGGMISYLVEEVTGIHEGLSGWPMDAWPSQTWRWYPYRGGSRSTIRRSWYTVLRDDGSGGINLDDAPVMDSPFVPEEVHVEPHEPASAEWAEGMWADTSPYYAPAATAKGAQEVFVQSNEPKAWGTEMWADTSAVAPIPTPKDHGEVYVSAEEPKPVAGLELWVDTDEPGFDVATNDEVIVSGTEPVADWRDRLWGDTSQVDPTRKPDDDDDQD